MSKTVRPPCHVRLSSPGLVQVWHRIGKTVASVYARNGIQGLALADVNIANLEIVQAELRKEYPDIRVEIFAMNVLKEEEIEAAVQSAASKFGRIDISVHGAGIIGFPSPTHEMPLEAWEPVIGINQTGVMLCDKWVIRQMLTQELLPGYQGRGMIVNIASVVGVSIPDGSLGAIAYTAAKHAVVGLTKLDAKTYAPQGIRINAICPGYVDTPLIHQALASQKLQVEIDRTALKRPAEAEEIANAVLFLTSPMGSYMCAHALVVDGGYAA
ncbi:hypothetical protein BJY01DRAFT_231105 [Aspergillus pseudoustus]|uniref:NAD(P)-binding protein n=1 Tax=Aspergillus pseudoustus TaxID=1810923 RepID=A0ABR4KZ48_9EURO